MTLEGLICFIAIKKGNSARGTGILIDSLDVIVI